MRLALAQVLLAVAAEMPPQQRAATQQEIDLVRAMGQGDGDAAAELYERYADRVCWFIYWRTGEQYEDAEELTLDTFINAVNLAREFSGRSSVFAWLCGIAKLRIVDHHRRKSAVKRSNGQDTVSLDVIDERVVDSSGSSDMATMLERISASQVVDLALRRLSDPEKDALLLRLVEDLSVREIACHLKRSEDAVESLIRRARTKLKDVLTGLMGAEVAR